MGLSTMDNSTRLKNLCLARLTRSRAILLGFFAFFFVVYVLSPYDSKFRSALRWQGTIATDYVQHKYPSDKWLYKNQKYPIDPAQDIAIVLKTGFGTRNRVPSVLAALGNETLDSQVLIVQDYPVIAKRPVFTASGKSVPTVDAIGWMIKNNKLVGHGKNERIMKYEHLSDAIEDEDYFMADTLAKGYGWELDAMKVSGPYVRTGDSLHTY